MKAPDAMIAANAVAPVRPAGTAVLVAEAEVVVAVREHPDRDGDQKVPAHAGLDGMVPEQRVDRGSVADLIGVIRAIKWSGATRRSHCRKSWLPSFRMKRASNPWLVRSR